MDCREKALGKGVCPAISETPTRPGGDCRKKAMGKGVEKKGTYRAAKLYRIDGSQKLRGYFMHIPALNSRAAVECTDKRRTRSAS